MAEKSLDGLQKSRITDSIRRQWKNARRWDETDAWGEERDGKQYILDFRGLSYSIDYIRSQIHVPIVLDIGCRNALGVSEIAASDLGEGIKFEATSLTVSTLAEKRLGRNNFFVTPAEKLDGIADESVGLALALYSIMFSKSPELVLQKIDQKLARGES